MASVQWAPQSPAQSIAVANIANATIQNLTVTGTASGAFGGGSAITDAQLSGVVELMSGSCLNFSSTCRGSGTFTALAGNTVVVFNAGSGIGQTQTILLIEYVSGTAGTVGRPFVTAKDGHSTVNVFCPSGNSATYTYVCLNIDPNGAF
jgi:hypothetical protein